jgi:DNA-binding NarL/FixJ family response regulator
MSSTRRIRVMIVDDHVFCRAGFVSLFQAVPNMDVVAATGEAEEAVRMAERCGPDVVLMDVTLPDNGAFRAAQRMAVCCPRSRVVFMDDAVRFVSVREALRVGASGYWTKHATFEEIAGAIRRASVGALTFCPSVRSQVLSVPGGVQLAPDVNGDLVSWLTRRQIQVLTHLANGLSVKQCAQCLHVSVSTVDNHKWRLMKKLGIHKAADLTRFALLNGLVTG